MSQLTFRIDPHILQRFPDIKVAALAARIDTPAQLAGLIGELASQLPSVVERVNAAEPITQLDDIAVWRQAYGAMSIKPSKFHSSIEALLRRVKKGDDISTGLPVVDLYNLISVTHGTPMGAYDRSKLKGDEMLLRLADPNLDRFDPLGGRAESFPINADLVVHAMESEILCWGFNSRDSAVSCVDESSQQIIFMSESVAQITSERPVVGLEALADHLAKLDIAISTVELADAENTTIALWPFENG
ncbi:MAG: phenylalanine--tRNA ligase beta subunit-related protein [Pseudomonadota bacterium]